MKKINITLNIINISFSILNLVLSIILQIEKSEFNENTKTTLVRYRYFEEVLINPYFKIIITSVFYDIFLYSVSFLLSKYFFGLKLEKNEENIRTKAIQDNMVSNIMVEFLFMAMIKGLALGFGIFYSIEIDKEIKRIINLKDINTDQEKILHTMEYVVILNGICNLITILYQFLFFGQRLCEECKSNKNYYIQENRLENLKKFEQKNLNKKKHERVPSSGNISLPETREGGITYDKLID